MVLMFEVVKAVAFNNQVMFVVFVDGDGGGGGVDGGGFGGGVGGGGSGEGGGDDYDDIDSDGTHV